MINTQLNVTKIDFMPKIEQFFTFYTDDLSSLYVKILLQRPWWRRAISVNDYNLSLTYKTQKP